MIKNQHLKIVFKKTKRLVIIGMIILILGIILLSIGSLSLGIGVFFPRPSANFGMFTLCLSVGYFLLILCIFIFIIGLLLIYFGFRDLNDKVM